MWKARLGFPSLFSCLSYKAFALGMFLLRYVFWALTENLSKSVLEQIKQSYYCLTTVYVTVPQLTFPFQVYVMRYMKASSVFLVLCAGTGVHIPWFLL